MTRKVDKLVSVLFVISNGEMLLEKNSSADDPDFAYDTFGVTGHDDSAVEELKNRLISIFGSKISEFEDFGTMVNIVNRPEDRVTIYGRVYRLFIDEKLKHQTKLPKRNVWFTPDNIKSDPAAKRAKPILLRAFEDRPFNLELEEDQYEKWIDGKMLRWEDK